MTDLVFAFALALAAVFVGGISISAPKNWKKKSTSNPKLEPEGRAGGKITPIGRARGKPSGETPACRVDRRQTITLTRPEEALPPSQSVMSSVIDIR